MVCSDGGQIVYKNKSLRAIPDFRRKTNIKSVLDDNDYQKYLTAERYGTDNAISRQLFNVKVRRREMCHVAYVANNAESIEERKEDYENGTTVWMFFRILQFIPPDLLERYSPYGFSGCLRYITDTAIECAGTGTRTNIFDERKFANRDVIIKKLDHMVKYILKYRRSITHDFEKFDLNDGINILKFITEIYLKSSSVSITLSDKATRKLNEFSVKSGHLNNFDKYSMLYASMLNAAAMVSEIADVTVTIDISDDLLVSDANIKILNPSPTSIKKIQNTFNSALSHKDDESSSYTLTSEDEGRTIKCTLKEEIIKYQSLDILSVKRPSIFKACDAELAIAIALFFDVFGTMML